MHRTDPRRELRNRRELLPDVSLLELKKSVLIYPFHLVKFGSFGEVLDHPMLCYQLG